LQKHLEKLLRVSRISFYLFERRKSAKSLTIVALFFCCRKRRRNQDGGGWEGIQLWFRVLFQMKWDVESSFFWEAGAESQEQRVEGN
jgi:hypothetical protein